MAEQPWAEHLAPQEEIGGRVQIRGEGEVLIDGFDPDAAGGHRRVEFDRRALNSYLARVGLENPRHALDESALAGAVVANERDDLPGVQREVRAPQRADSAEALVQLACLQQWLGHYVPPSWPTASAGLSPPAARPAVRGAPRAPADTPGGGPKGRGSRPSPARAASPSAHPPVVTSRWAGPATEAIRASSTAPAAPTASSATR